MDSMGWVWAWPLSSQPRPLHAPPQTDTGTSRQGGGRGVRRGHWGRCSDAMGRVQTQSDGQTDGQTGLYLRSSVSRRGGVGGIRHHECPRKAGRVGKMPRGEGPAGTESWPRGGGGPESSHSCVGPGSGHAVAGLSPPWDLCQPCPYPYPHLYLAASSVPGNCSIQSVFWAPLP
jgi:hypothetical protein